MPHSTSDMGEPTINGDMPKSQFISHLSSYPVVDDISKTVSDNPYGAKLIDITNAGYAKLVKPTFPYLQTPYSYTKPYIAKADEMGDAALSKMEEKVPLVKSEGKEIKSTVVDYAMFPLVKTGQLKDYFFNTYKNEYQKCGGDGVMAGGKAMVTSYLVVLSDSIGALGTFLSTKKEEAKKTTKEKANN